LHSLDLLVGGSVVVVAGVVADLFILLLLLYYYYQVFFSFVHLLPVNLNFQISKFAKFGQIAKIT
jgi:hypothetical protein